MHLSRPRLGRWSELALVASLLACGICQASGQISIVPFTGLEGFESYLVLKHVPEGAQEYSWYRGAHDNEESKIVSYKPPSNSWQPGPMSSSRENVTKTGDLEIKESMLSDAGNYTVRVTLSSGTQKATSWLAIQEWVGKPNISANATSVAENLDPVVAFCHTNVTNTTRIQWYLNALKVSSNDQVTISPDRKALIIHQLSRYDFTIQCSIDNVFEIPEKSDIIFLTVAYGPDRVMLNSTPSTLGGVLSTEVGSRVQMQCSSTSRPLSTYRWTHNGSFLSSEASVLLPRLTWEQMGRYRCFVENSVTQLTLYRDIRIQRPWQMPVIRTGFYLSGPLVVFFIVMTVLGSVYLCGILIYILISRFSTRTSRAI